MNDTRKIIQISVLSALGALLMLLPIPYPPVPFLKFELSEIVVLLVVVVFGFVPGIIVAVAKALINLLVFGPSGPIAIGHITAVIASLTMAFAYYFFRKILNKRYPNKPLFAKILSLVYTGLIFTVVMVIANYLFITPVYMGEITFLGVKDWLTPETFGLDVSQDFIDPYLFAILIVYVPFNLLKAAAILTLYGIIEDRLLEIYREFMKRF